MRQQVTRRSVSGLIGGVAGALVVPNKPTVTAAADGAVTDSVAEANKAVIRRWIDEVVNGGNLALVDELFAPNYRSHPDEGTIATVKSTAETWQNKFENAYATVDDIIASGDRVAVRISWHGTRRWSSWRRSQSKQRVAVLNVSIFRLVDGKIVEAWGLTDDSGLHRQLALHGRYTTLA